MKTVAIIGAGSGLGLSLAKKFGEKGFKVAAISRNPEKLSIIVSERECLLPPEEAGASCFNDLCLSLEKGLT
jgi:NAD(P)-dependent dehydrogenase (short-subunit alcohol dehydrogenase family)